MTQDDWKLFLPCMILLILAVSIAQGQTITADRPGIGIDPETVPAWTLQPEAGTDGQEIRFGFGKGFEVDAQRGGGDNVAGVKLGLIHRPKIKASLRLAYDRQAGAVIEVPANVTLADWFNLGLDASLSRSSRTYAAEFNFQPTSRLTITPTIYDDGRLRAAIFAAWARGNLQFDAGYDGRRVSAGISTAIDLKRR